MYYEKSSEALIRQRYSCRDYASRTVEDATLEKLLHFSRDIRPPFGSRLRCEVVDAQVISGGSRVFSGTYGFIKNAPLYLVGIGQRNDKLLYEDFGYFFEGIILKATDLDLNTCWVGGLFKPQALRSRLEIEDYETIIAITPVGISPKRYSFEERVLSAFGLTHRRKDLSELTIGLKEKSWPEWIKAAIHAARLAPSALNRQPWRFHIQKNSIAIATNKGETKRDSVMSKRLDCGIAMLHIEVAAMSHNIRGYWEFHDPPLVAKFTAET